MHDVPPPAIGADRILEYAIIDASMTFTGRMVIYVDGVLLGPVPRLAICQGRDASRNGSEILLYHCDGAWDVLAVSGGGSLEDVKQRAGCWYVGLTGRWIASPYTQQETDGYVEEQAELACSFCGKLIFDVEKIIAAGDTRHAICDICIDDFYREIHS